VQDRLQGIVTIYCPVLELKIGQAPLHCENVGQSFCGVTVERVVDGVREGYAVV
jgi:hypothetical protein